MVDFSPTHSHHASLYKHNALLLERVRIMPIWNDKQFTWNANTQHNTRKCEIYAMTKHLINFFFQNEDNNQLMRWKQPERKKNGTKWKQKTVTSDRINAQTRSLCWLQRCAQDRSQTALFFAEWKEQSDNKHERFQSDESVRLFNVRGSIDVGVMNKT